VYTFYTLYFMDQYLYHFV